jgi:hypothetical protein
MWKRGQVYSSALTMSPHICVTPPNSIRVVAVEELVVDAGVARGHRVLDIEDRHAADRRGGVGLGRGVGHAVGANTKATSVEAKSRLISPSSKASSRNRKMPPARDPVAYGPPRSWCHDGWALAGSRPEVTTPARPSARRRRGWCGGRRAPRCGQSAGRGALSRGCPT